MWRRLFLRPVPSRQLSTAIINDIQYHLPTASDRPIVAICIDGSSIDYMTAAMNANSMPNLQQWISSTPDDPISATPGYSRGLVTAVMPTFTNPNNVSIITGTTPNHHGICGNYFYDEKTGQEVPMTDPRQIEVPTILSEFESRHIQVIMCTTKNKLYGLLSSGLNEKRSILISSERADDDMTTSHLSQHGIQGGIRSLLPQYSSTPTIYDPQISIHCLDTGIALLEHHVKTNEKTPVVVYCSTTDYVQHTYAPGHPVANAFYADIDSCLGRFHQLNAVIGFTADHGMSDKITGDGSPNVLYLKSTLTQLGIDGRIVLPITDPYVAHHSGLGSFATITVNDKSKLEGLCQSLRSMPGVYTVLYRADAAREMDLPIDRIGDLVLVATRDTVFGNSPADHDLTALCGAALRSHGGYSEATVPMQFNCKLNSQYAKRLHSGKMRNFQLFETLCNGTK